MLFKNISRWWGSSKYTVLGYTGLLMFASTAATVSLAKEIPTFFLLGCAFSVASLFSILQITWVKEWGQVLRVRPLMWGLTFMGICGVTLCYVLAFQYAPAAPADLIIYTWPILVFVFSSFFLPKESITFKSLIPAFIAFVGASLPFLKQLDGNAYSSRHLVGYGFAFLCSFIWSSYIVLSRRLPEKHFGLPGLVTAFGVPLAFGLHGLYESPVVLSSLNWPVILYYGVFCLSLAYGLWYLGIAKGNFKLLNTSSYFNPILSVGLLIVLGQAEFSATLGVSCALVTLGTLLIQRF